jgi:hypothetical protein
MKKTKKTRRLNEKAKVEISIAKEMGDTFKTRNTAILRFWPDQFNPSCSKVRLASYLVWWMRKVFGAVKEKTHRINGMNGSNAQRVVINMRKRVN